MRAAAPNGSIDCRVAFEVNQPVTAGVLVFENFVAADSRDEWALPGP